MLDDTHAFTLIEYDDSGEPVRQSIESVPIQKDPALELEEAGYSRTGARAVPDNTESFGLIFLMKVTSTEPASRRFIPVWEVDKPWRRGWGITTHRGNLVRIWGFWWPHGRPKLPKVEVFIDHAEMHTAPGDLI